MLQVLVIETDLRVARALRAEGYSVTTERPEAPSLTLLACDPDLVVVDLCGGLSFRRWFLGLRERLEPEGGGVRIAYLVLVSPEDVSPLANSGFMGDFMVCADDKLFPVELRARLRRLARAHAPHKVARVLEIDGLSIDREGYEVRVDGALVELTYQEFLLLSFLAANKGKVFTRQQLLARVWGYNYFGGTRTVDIHIRRIRAKLAPRYDRYIRTIRQVGYKFAQETQR